MLKNLKKHRAHLFARGELAEAKAYNFFPVSFEMPKVHRHRHGCVYVLGADVPRHCVLQPKPTATTVSSETHGTTAE